MKWLPKIIAVFILLIFVNIEPVMPITTLGMKVIGVFLFTIILWIDDGIGTASILCIALLVLLSVASPEEAFALSIGNWVVFFLIGCFGLSEGLKLSGFTQRFALWFLNRKFLIGKPKLLLAMFLLSCTIIGSVMSQTVTVVIYMVIASSMLNALGYKKGMIFLLQL